MINLENSVLIVVIKHNKVKEMILMPSGLQSEWRNEIGLSSEFIQRSKGNTNALHHREGLHLTTARAILFAPLCCTWHFLLGKRMLFSPAIVFIALYYF